MQAIRIIVDQCLYITEVGEPHVMLMVSFLFILLCDYHLVLAYTFLYTGKDLLALSTLDQD